MPAGWLGRELRQACEQQQEALCWGAVAMPVNVLHLAFVAAFIVINTVGHVICWVQSGPSCFPIAGCQDTASGTDRAAPSTPVASAATPSWPPKLAA
jgi:hypothetical protein